MNGRDVSEYEMEDGDILMGSHALTLLKSIWHFFSWYKKGNANSSIYSRIYHWSIVKVESSVNYFNPGISDHSPLVLDTAVKSEVGMGLFKFFNHLVQHPMFMNIITQIWSNELITQGFRAIVKRLEMTKQMLKELQNNGFVNSGQKLRFWEDKVQCSK